MLINFSVTNFLSFNQKTCFSMESGRVTKKPDHTLQDPVYSKNLLKFAAIYGKNGAGKTNFIRAVAVLRNFVLTGKLPQRAPILWCQILKENETKPTDFEISFITDKTLFEYKISIVLSTGIIIKEELAKVVGNRHTKLFSKEVPQNEYKFHHSIKGQNNNIEVLSQTFSMSGAPFLFYINNNTEGLFAVNPQAVILKKAFLWFKDTLEVLFPDQPLQETSLTQYEACKDEFSSLLKYFDTEIEDIDLQPTSKEKVFENLDLRTQQKINAHIFLFTPFTQVLKFPAIGQKEIQVKANHFSSVIRNRRNIFFINYEKDGFKFYSIKFVHKFIGNTANFNMESESDGTYRLFQLLEILICNKEKVYIMDEMNRSLHPKLTVQFVKKFFSKAKDRRIQLITTTHETRIMNHDTVRRDEIWLADKNEDKSTKLFSLEEKQVRIDKVLEENYINKEWGGVPEFEDEEK